MKFRCNPHNKYSVKFFRDYVKGSKHTVPLCKTIHDCHNVTYIPAVEVEVIKPFETDDAGWIVATVLRTEERQIICIG